MAKEEVDIHTYDKILGQALVDMFKVETAVDIGCGNGEYTRNFLNHGVLCVGYDGSPLTPEVSKGLCQVKDFSEPVDIGQFDLVLSLEVGEHIPRQYEQIFIDNLCKAAKKYICLSWGVEGQGGYGHVNCRNNDYIIKEMRHREFEMNVEMTRILRNRCSLPWFSYTVMVFENNKKEYHEFK